MRIDTPETGQEDAIYRYSILTPTTITAAYQPLIISAALHSIERREKLGTFNPIPSFHPIGAMNHAS